MLYMCTYLCQFYNILCACGPEVGEGSLSLTLALSHTKCVWFSELSVAEQFKDPNWLVGSQSFRC